MKSGPGTGLPDVGSWSCGGGSCGGSCDGSCGKRGWKWPLCSGWSAEGKRFVFAAWPFRAWFSSLSSRCHRLRMAWSVRPGNDWEIWLHLCPCACGVAPRLRSEPAAAPGGEGGESREQGRWARAVHVHLYVPSSRLPVVSTTVHSRRPPGAPPGGLSLAARRSLLSRLSALVFSSPPTRCIACGCVFIRRLQVVHELLRAHPCQKSNTARKCTVHPADRRETYNVGCSRRCSSSLSSPLAVSRSDHRFLARCDPASVAPARERRLCEQALAPSLATANLLEKAVDGPIL